MKLHKPLFSIILILLQLIIALRSYYYFVEWGKANPELERIICRIFNDDSLFIFVLIIGFYEMLTKPSFFKNFIRIFLICIVLGTTFAGFIPIDDFYSIIYNTAQFSAVLAITLMIIKVLKYRHKNNYSK